MENITTVGVDLSKNLMHAVFMTANGRVVKRKKYSKIPFIEFAKELPPKAVICAEACAGSHCFGRYLQNLNFKVKLMPPQYVKPYVQRNKNDFNDATAIAEAANRADMKYVPVKSEYIQGVQSLHSVRSQMVSTRTQYMNCIRGLLLESGVIIPQGIAKLTKYIKTQYADDARIHQYTRMAIDGMLKTLNEILQTLIEINKEITKIAKTNDVAKRLSTISGVGPMTATSLITVSGNPSIFKNGRAFSANLGLTPRQYTTGDKPRLLGISKQGNIYVRSLLTICARSLMVKAEKTVVSTTRQKEYRSNDKMSLWIRRLLARNVHKNKVCIAVANKLARISYRILIGNEVKFDANLSNECCLMQ